MKHLIFHPWKEGWELSVKTETGSLIQATALKVQVNDGDEVEALVLREGSLTPPRRSWTNIVLKIDSKSVILDG